MATVLYGEVVDKKFLGAKVLNAANDSEFKIDYVVILRYLCKEYAQIVCVLMLMTVVSVILGIFLGFHLYITACNMTTNEFFKWRQVKQWHEKETQKFRKALTYGKVENVSNDNDEKSGVHHISTSEIDVGCTGPVEEVAVVEKDDIKGISDPVPMPKYIYE
jgi:hypothetical protein